jgi:hypothetical protein
MKAKDKSEYSRKTHNMAEFGAVLEIKLALLHIFLIAI